MRPAESIAEQDKLLQFVGVVLEHFERNAVCPARGLQAVVELLNLLVSAAFCEAFQVAACSPPSRPRQHSSCPLPRAFFLPPNPHSL